MDVFSRKLKLKVIIKDLKLDLWLGRCEFIDITVYHPSPQDDPRWRSEIMASAQKVICTFDPFISLYAYFTSVKKFAVFDTIHVSGIDINVEGYESEGQKTLLNLKLIGGEQKNLQRLRKPTYIELKHQERLERRRRRQQLAQARAEAAAQSIRNRSGSVSGGHKASGGLDGSAHGHLDRSGHCKPPLPAPQDPPAQPVVPVQPIVRPHPSTETPAKQTNNISSWLSTAHVLKNNITSKLNELREEVKDQGLIETMKTKTAQAIAATKVTVDAVYQKAKKKLGDSFQTRIAMLHERIRGGEPIEFPHEFQMQANCITFTDIHVSLYHAFPPSFRQFEKRGLFVPQVMLKNVDGISKFQPIQPSSANAKTKSEPMNLKKSDDLDSSTRAKTTKVVEEAKQETLMDQRSRSNTSTSSPLREKSVDHVDSSHPVRRKSLKEYLSHPKDDQLGGTHSEERYAKPERLESDDPSDLKASGTVWTEVSSVSSESDLEHLHEHDLDHQVLKTEKRYMRYPIWKKWLSSRNDHDNRKPISTATPTEGHTDESNGHTSEAERDIDQMDPAVLLHQSRSRSSTSSELSVEDSLPVLLHGNSIVFTASELDDYTKLRAYQHLHSLYDHSKELLKWLEGYINKFITTIHHFSGIPTCVVVYRLERILLYEMLKDNTGRLLQDAWNDLGSSFKNVEDDDDEEDMESSVHLPATSIHPEIPLFPIEI